MKRNEHLFQFTGLDISKAADGEAKYHSQRLEFWEEEQRVEIARAKDSGVSVREYDVTGGKAVNLVVDTELQARLTLCANKISGHRKARDDFRIQADCYGTQPSRTYELHPDDVIYFRLAGGAREF